MNHQVLLLVRISMCVAFFLCFSRSPNLWPFEKCPKQSSSPSWKTLWPIIVVPLERSDLHSCEVFHSWRKFTGWSKSGTYLFMDDLYMIHRLSIDYLQIWLMDSSTFMELAPNCSHGQGSSPWPTSCQRAPDPKCQQLRSWDLLQWDIDD